jgi:Fe-S oxidoreductase/FAD/FMN-containing dehydrogenase
MDVDKTRKMTAVVPGHLRGFSGISQGAEKMLGKTLIENLTGVFCDRIAFHENERMLYARDIGGLPAFVEKQIESTPDAVIQPDSLEDLKALTDLAGKEDIPLVPRGSGTAGYGGAVPVRGGIVVDFHRLRNIVSVSKDEETVTVESGVLWSDLEKELNECDLSLRLYPGSAISSTVGGWLSNGGGVGIGSYEYCRFADNVLEVTIVTPQGIRRLSRDEVHLVDGMAGTTGLIYQVKFLVRKRDNDIPIVAAFPRLSDMQKAFYQIKTQNLALWEVDFKDPLHVKLCHEAVIKRQRERSHDNGHDKVPRPPEGRFLATFVCPEQRYEKAVRPLSEIIVNQGGDVLDAELARLEWEERFFPVRLKALGPSLVQSEAMIPAEKLSAFTSNIRRKARGVALDGTLVNRGEEAAVLTYLLDDERRRGFLMAYSSGLITINEAKKLGGKVYAVGMFLIGEAEHVFGKKQLQEAIQFKKTIDPHGVLNPGKVHPDALRQEPSVRKLNRMVGLARNTTGLLKLADSLVGGKHNGKEVIPKGTPATPLFMKEAVWDAYACLGCGYCRSACPVFNAVGWESSSPRGKFRLLRQHLEGNIKLDERTADMFFACTTCQKCNVVCQVKSHIEEDWAWVAKPALLKEGFQPPALFQRQAYNILTKRNPSGSLQDKRAAWMTSDLKYAKEGTIAYFAGCAQSYTYTLRNLPINAVRILNKAGIEPAYLGPDEWCCGGATLNIGCYEELSENVIHNIEEFKRRGVDTIVTSCSSCRHNLSHVYPVIAQQLKITYDVKVKHIVEIASELIEQGVLKCEFPINTTVTYHDPCHLGRSCGVFDPPRKILASIPGLKFIEMPSNREQSSCCGKHIMRYPRLGVLINSARTDEAIKTGAEAVVCSCSTCENNFRTGIAEKKAGLEVIDIMDLVAETVGLPRLSVSKLGKLLRDNKQARERR